MLECVKGKGVLRSWVCSVNIKPAKNQEFLGIPNLPLNSLNCLVLIFHIPVREWGADSSWGRQHPLTALAAEQGKLTSLPSSLPGLGAVCDCECTYVPECMVVCVCVCVGEYMNVHVIVCHWVCVWQRVYVCDCDVCDCVHVCACVWLNVYDITLCVCMILNKCVECD